MVARDEPWVAPALRPVPAFDHRGGGVESRYHPRIGAVICARVAAGETITSITSDPRMPCRATLYRWLQVHEDFAVAYAAVRDARAASDIDAAALKREGAAWRRAHERRLTGKPARDWVSGQKSRYTEAAGRAFCLAVASGLSLAEATARPGMPSVKQVYSWLKRFPEFRRAYVAAKRAQRAALEAEAERLEFVAFLLPGAKEEAARIRGRIGRMTPKVWRRLPRDFPTGT